MAAHVFKSRQDLEVIGFVIVNVAINMMDNFSIAQCTTKFLFGNNAVLMPSKKLSITSPIAAAPLCVSPSHDRRARNPRIIFWPLGRTPNAGF